MPVIISADGVQDLCEGCRGNYCVRCDIIDDLELLSLFGAGNDENRKTCIQAPAFQ